MMDSNLVHAADAPAIYRPGQKIEYKPTSYIDKWEAGTVVEMTPGNAQVIVRGQPNQFYKDGPQSAYALDQVRLPQPKAPDEDEKAVVYQPGQQVEYKEYGSNDKWVPGTVVEMTPSGKQVIVRGQPNQFYKNGPQSAYTLDRVREMKQGQAPEVPPVNPGATVLNPLPPPPRGDAMEIPTRPEPAAPVADGPAADNGAKGAGLMTQADILAYLQAQFGDQPFQHPNREKVLTDLGTLIKQRGVNFRYVNLSDFSNALGKYGASSQVIFPIQANYGPPTKLPELFGSYSMDIIGATVVVEVDSKLYRQGEMGAKGGTLTIKADGTYTWLAYAKDKETLVGKWRKATVEEMSYQGGDGLVLLKAKAGWDWIVMADRATDGGGWVTVSDLGTRQMREFGFRAGTPATPTR